ncbi:hypothetical protein ES703_21907 [subsurface metagenome]
MLENVAIRILQFVFGGGGNINAANPLPVTSEIGADQGTASGGSNTTLEDTAKDWEVNIWEDAVLQVEIGGIEYHRTIVSNTDDTLTINALPAGPPLVEVASGDVYIITRAVNPLTPISKGIIHSPTAVLANTNFFGADLAPTNTPCKFLATGAFSAAGILNVMITRGGVTVPASFNHAVVLVPNALFSFYHIANSGDTINYQYTVGATIVTFKVIEIPSAL